MTTLEQVLENIYSYPIGTMSVTCDWLCDLSMLDRDDQFKALQDASYRITNEDNMYSGMIERFNELNVLVHGVGESLDSFQFPSFVDTQGKSSRYRSRFLIVEVGGAFVYVPMRIQDSPGLRKTGKKPYLMVYGIISTDCSTRTEELVENYLKTISCLETIRKTADKFPEGNRCSVNYYSTQEDFCSMERSSWRSSHGINKLANMLDVKILRRDAMTDKQIKDVERMCADWHKIKLGTKDPENAKLEDYFMLNYKWRRQLRWFLFYIDGILVGHSIVDALGNIAYVNVFRPASSLGEDYMVNLGISTDVAKYLKSNLCNFMVYKIDEFLLRGENPVDAIYIGGDMQGSKNGLEAKKRGQDISGYKARLFKNKIDYVKLPLC